MVPKAISLRSNQENLRSLKSLILLMFNPENLNTQQTWALVKIRERPPTEMILKNQFQCSQIRKESWKPSRRSINWSIYQNWSKINQNNFYSRLRILTTTWNFNPMTIHYLNTANWIQCCLVRNIKICLQWRYPIGLSTTVFAEIWVCWSLNVSKDTSWLRTFVIDMI